jgi:hypothetical protein
MKKIKVGDLLFPKEERLKLSFNNEHIINRSNSFFQTVQKEKINSLKYLTARTNFKYLYKLNGYSSFTLQKEKNKKKLPKLKKSSSSRVFNIKKHAFEDDIFIESDKDIFETNDLNTQLSKSLIQNSIFQYKLFIKLKRQNKFLEFKNRFNKYNYCKEVLYRINQNFKNSIFKNFEYRNIGLKNYNRKFLLKIRNEYD